MMVDSLKSKVVLFLMLCILSFTFVSCITTSNQLDATEAPALEPAALLKYADIPIPTGIKFVSTESYGFQSTDFRAALLKYTGKATGDQMVAFFKEQMPLYNWRLINIIEYGRRMLSFEKAQEACIITIDPKGNKADLTISVAPKSQGTLPKTKKTLIK